MLFTALNLRLQLIFFLLQVLLDLEDLAPIFSNVLINLTIHHAHSLICADVCLNKLFHRFDQAHWNIQPAFRVKLKQRMNRLISPEAYGAST
jgi:hypothetical protein